MKCQDCGTEFKLRPDGRTGLRELEETFKTFHLMHTTPNPTCYLCLRERIAELEGEVDAAKSVIHAIVAKAGGRVTVDYKATQQPYSLVVTDNPDGTRTYAALEGEKFDPSKKQAPWLEGE